MKILLDPAGKPATFPASIETQAGNRGLIVGVNMELQRCLVKINGLHKEMLCKPSLIGYKFVEKEVLLKQ